MGRLRFCSPQMWLRKMATPMSLTLSWTSFKYGKENVSNCFGE